MLHPEIKLSVDLKRGAVTSFSADQRLPSHLPRKATMNIEGSVALVTGANRGIGLAIVKALIERGASTVYAGARDVASVPEIGGVVPVSLDVTDHEQVAALARQLGDVDLVVNNAGIGLASPALGDHAIDAARAELEVNFFGTFAVSRAFAPVLKANGGGAIVNILSILSFISSPSLATYAVSKSAAWSLTNALRIELSGQGTHVVGVHPAFVDTDLVAGLDVPKISPATVAAAALDAVESGAPEALVDERTQNVKAALSRDQELIYPSILAAAS